MLHHHRYLFEKADMERQQRWKEVLQVELVLRGWEVEAGDDVSAKLAAVDQTQSLEDERRKTKNNEKQRMQRKEKEEVAEEENLIINKPQPHRLRSRETCYSAS